MGCIQSFISEYSINREILHRLEFWLLSQSVKHLGTDGCCVGSQQILLGFVNVPIILISKRSITSFFMNFFDSFSEFLWEVLAVNRLLKEKCIMHVSSRMTLRLKKSIEVPKRTLYESVGRHLIEPHFQQDFSEMRPHFQQRVQMTPAWIDPHCVKIVLFELSVLPSSTSEHLN